MSMLKRLSAAGYPDILPCLAGSPCGAVYPLSVVEGRQHGEIYAAQDSFLLWHACGFAYLYGACREDVLEAVREAFMQRSTRRFVLFTGEQRIADFFRGKDGLKPGRRLAFFYPQTASPPPAALPEGFRICEIGRELFAALPGRITPLFSWSDAGAFLRHGKGYCILHGETPAAWAFSAAVSSEEIDIGVETSPEYRNRGLATLAAAQMLRYCIRIGKKPVWACDAANTGSQKLAGKLGFLQSTDYIIIRK